MGLSCSKSAGETALCIELGVSTSEEDTDGVLGVDCCLTKFVQGISCTDLDSDGIFRGKFSMILCVDDASFTLPSVKGDGRGLLDVTVSGLGTQNDAASGEANSSLEISRMCSMLHDPGLVSINLLIALDVASFDNIEGRSLCSLAMFGKSCLFSTGKLIPFELVPAKELSSSKFILS